MCWGNIEQPSFQPAFAWACCSVTFVQPLPAAGKEKSTEYLLQCLDVVGIRADTLSRIVDGYAAYLVRYRDVVRLWPETHLASEGVRACGGLGVCVLVFHSVVVDPANLA